MAEAARKEPSQQARSRETLRRLLDATEKLLDERRLEDVPVSEIVRVAGSSVGSFYARFPGKEALFVALVERYHDDVRAELQALAADARWNRLSLASRVRSYVARVIEHCRQRRGLLRLRLQRRLLPGGDGALADEPAHNREMVAQIGRLFASCRSEIRRPDADGALAFSLRMVDSVATTTIALDDVSANYGAIDDARLVDQLTQAVFAYLTMTRPRRPKGTADRRRPRAALRQDRCGQARRRHRKFWPGRLAGKSGNPRRPRGDRAGARHERRRLPAPWPALPFASACILSRS